MVEVSQYSFCQCSDLVLSLCSCSYAALVPEVENPNDISPGSTDAFVNMYDFDSCFDDSLSDATYQQCQMLKNKLQEIKLLGNHYQHWVTDSEKWTGQILLSSTQPREEIPLNGEKLVTAYFLNLKRWRTKCCVLHHPQ